MKTQFRLGMICLFAFTLLAVMAKPGFSATATKLADKTFYDDPWGGGVDGLSSTPGYALSHGLTGGRYWIDSATSLFDLGATPAVASATLHLHVYSVWDNGAGPVINTYAWSDASGSLTVSDYGSGALADSRLMATTTDYAIDVTAAVNAALGSGPYVGFLLTNSRLPGVLTDYEGVDFGASARLDYELAAVPVPTAVGGGAIVLATWLGIRGRRRAAV